MTPEVDPLKAIDRIVVKYWFKAKKSQGGASEEVAELTNLFLATIKLQQEALLDRVVKEVIGIDEKWLDGMTDLAYYDILERNEDLARQRKAIDKLRLEL